MYFWDFLFPPRVDERAVRGISEGDFLALMVPAVVARTEPAAVALLPFIAPPVRAAIHEAKYHGSERALGLLASALADYLRDPDALHEFGHPMSEGHQMSLIPVPLGELRLRERGFNQAEEIARRALRLLGDGTDVEIDTEMLVRVRETASQVSLPRAEREENMRGAFKAARRADPRRTYVLVDDVMTTGATLQAAADALKEAGAKRLLPLALAH